MSIPKKIHYCWFGGGELTDLMKKCMASWNEFCPDYEIIEWNESNVDLSKCPYAQEAFKNKKWAFVSDYVRTVVVYEHGGIYLDTDVMLKKNLDPLLENQAYAGWEEGAIANGLGFGAEKHNPLLKESIEIIENLPATDENGKFKYVILPGLNEVLLNHGMEKRDDIIQQVESFTIYPREYFCPYDIRLDKLKITPNTYSVHYYSASWYTDEQKKERIRKTKHRRMQKLLGNRLYKIWAKLHRFFCEGGLKSFLKSHF